MSLSASERARYARQTLLPEIGSAGQERLCAASIVPSAHADTAAWSVARDYLLRAGATIIADDTQTDAADAHATFTCDVPAADVIATMIGDEQNGALRHAAAAFAGAFAAVETIKAIVNAGAPATLPSHLVLISEES